MRPSRGAPPNPSRAEPGPSNPPPRGPVGHVADAAVARGLAEHQQGEALAFELPLQRPRDRGHLVAPFPRPAAHGPTLPLPGPCDTSGSAGTSSTNLAAPPAG